MRQPRVERFTEVLLKQTVLRHHVGAGEHDGNDGHELDQNVQRRTGGVLERVADGVANDGSIVSLVALLGAGNVVLLDGFLGVVPGTAGVGHEEGHEHTGHQGPCEQPPRAS